MIYLQLFLNFLKIGVVSFGGGYGMIPLIQETVISHGWLTQEEILNFIAVSDQHRDQLQSIWQLSLVLRKVEFLVLLLQR